MTVWIRWKSGRGDARQQGLVILGRRVLALVQGQAQLAEEGAQFFQALRRRAVMHAIQRRHTVLVQEFGGGDVGRQHAFLDQLVGIVAHGRADFRDLALVTEDDAGFLGFEVDGATGVTGIDQHLVQVVQVLQIGQDFLVLLAQRLALTGAAVFEHAADLVVGQTRDGSGLTPS